MLPLTVPETPEYKINKKSSAFIAELFGEGFYGLFTPYVYASTSYIHGAKGSKAFAIFNRQVKNLYGFLVEEMGWDKEEFKLILYNICLNEEPKPFTVSTYYTYEKKFINGDLKTISWKK